mmetsp:Transcript_19755/g.29528  ORF Transcript_19755/g.29528 Transcript_19755/m.29528 type:complete len:301 (-) Transcript_19755:30-932(-)
MKTVGLCFKILSTFRFIFFFSSASISATACMELTRTRAPKILILSVSMGVLATRTFASVTHFACPIPKLFSRMNPSSRYESFIEPPFFLMTWMCSRSVLPFRRKTASTARLAKCSLCCERILELIVVRAIWYKSSFNFSGSDLLSFAAASSASRATFTAFRHPAKIVWGWIFFSTRRSASRRSSPANTVTLVVPSPITVSWVLEVSMRIFAAGFSGEMDFKMVAPSLVTMTFFGSLADCKILSIPFGPRVDFTRSAIAKAPIEELSRAFAPFSSRAPCASLNKDGPTLPNILRRSYGVPE